MQNLLKTVNSFQMAYQRTEYADKTLSMNSLADRKLKIQLDSIDCRKGSIGKEIDREKKKLRKELVEAEEYMRKRLNVSDTATVSEKRLSPRLPRRYSTPPAVLAANLPSRNLLEVGRRSPNIERRLSGPEVMLMELSSRDQAFSSDVLPSPRSSTPTLLKPPFNQPRRQSLPPLSPGGIISQDFKEHLSNRPRSPSSSVAFHSHSQGSSLERLTTPRNSPSRGNTAFFEAESVQMEEVSTKVNKFLKSFDKIKKEQDCCENSSGQTAQLVTSQSGSESRLEAYEGDSSFLQSGGTLKRSSSAGVFQPANFE